MKKVQTIITFLLLTISFYTKGQSINFIVKAKITALDNQEYSGYFVNSFPVDFHFNDKETLERIKSSSSDSLFLEQIKIVSDGRYIFKFSNSYYAKLRFGIHDIKSIHVAKHIIDPFPIPFITLHNDDFKIFDSQLNKIQFITCSEYNPVLRFHFTLLSFSSDELLNGYIKKIEKYLIESTKSGNISDFKKNIDSIEEECKKDNILFIKGINESSYFKFDNSYNSKNGIDIKAFINF